MIDLLMYLFFIVAGFYGTVFYKKASRQALEERKKINMMILHRELKVGKKTEIFHDYITFFISAIFLIVGLINLIRIVMYR